MSVATANRHVVAMYSWYLVEEVLPYISWHFLIARNFLNTHLRQVLCIAYVHCQYNDEVVILMCQKLGGVPTLMVHSHADGTDTVDQSSITLCKKYIYWVNFQLSTNSENDDVKKNI